MLARFNFLNTQTKPSSVIMAVYGVSHGTSHVALAHHILCSISTFDAVNIINSYSASHDNWCTVGGDGGCRVGEIRAGTTSPIPDHKGFKLQ